MTITRISSGRERTEMRFPVVRLVVGIDLGGASGRVCFFSVGVFQFFGASQVEKSATTPFSESLALSTSTPLHPTHQSRKAHIHSREPDVSREDQQIFRTYMYVIEHAVATLEHALAHSWRVWIMMGRRYGTVRYSVPEERLISQKKKETKL